MPDLGYRTWAEGVVGLVQAWMVVRRRPNELELASR